ncbi:MAG: aldo/keto reductase [Spirochaetaceae bacterium]|nr:aldo/keto reductase [Spirochaetaceae bacterium]
MKYGTIAGIGKPVARLVCGTMVITDEEEARPKGPWGDLNRELSFALLDAIAAGGGNTFDTAHVYGIGGAGEKGLGLWMAERGNRDELVIIGKGGVRPSPPAPYKVMPSFIDADLFETLARLQTGYVDLYMMHYDDPAAPLGPLMETLNAHLAAGRTRTIGCSNMTHERFEEANEYADKRGLEPLVASEPQYSLAEQGAIYIPGSVSISGPAHRNAREWYAGTGMPVIPYSSLGSGFFSGLLRPGTFDEVKERMNPTAVRVYACEANFERLERVATLAERMGASVAQIALAFLLTGPLNVFALTGPRSPAEFADNTAALEITLTPAERAWLDLETDTAP